MEAKDKVEALTSTVSSVNLFTQLDTDESAATPEVARTGQKRVGKLVRQRVSAVGVREKMGALFSVGNQEETPWLQLNGAGP